MLGGRSHSTGIRNRRGAALVEFAIVAILLFMLIFAIIDFGLALHDYLALSQVAREAARSYGLGGSTARVDSVVDEWRTKLGLTKYPIIRDYTTEGPSTDQAAVVKLTYQHDWIAAGLLGLGSYINLEATMVTRKE